MLTKNFELNVNLLENQEDEESDENEMMIKLMQSGEYPDADIDKLLETLNVSGNFNSNILNGDFVENDIRLSENIREAISEIKQIQARSGNKVADRVEKKRFLFKYVEVSKLIGTSLTVEYLLPTLADIVKTFNVLIILGQVRFW